MPLPARREQTAYIQALIEARRAGYALTADGMERIRQAFRDAMARLTADASDIPLQAARQAELRQQLQAMLRELERATNQTVGGTVLGTAKGVADVHRQTLMGLARAAGVTESARPVISAAFGHVPVRAVAAMNARRANAATFQTLVRRNMSEAAPELDRMLGAAVAQGMSPARLTRDIATLLSGNDPDVAAYGMRASDVSGIRTLFSDARRIAVTETNNALREANTMSLQESPVIAAKWTLSGRHGALRQGVPDECDDLAEVDLYDHGPGMHLVEQWPLAPHPYCACTQGGPCVYMPFEEWLERQREGGDAKRDRDEDDDRTTSVHVPKAEKPPENITVEPPPEPPAPPAFGGIGSMAFTPATTVDDAMQAHLQFTAAGTGTPLSVARQRSKMGGASLDALNDMNEGFTQVMRPFGVTVTETGLSYEKSALALYTREIRVKGDPRPPWDSITFRREILQDARGTTRASHVEWSARRADNLKTMERALASDVFSAPDVRASLALQYDELKATVRWSVANDAANPLRSIAAHEAGHAVMFRRGLEDVWNAALKKHGVTRVEMLRVSEYAASKTTELWSEAIALLAEGRAAELPESIAKALQEVLASIT